MLPEFRQTIVAAALIIVGRVWALGTFFDQVIFEQALDGAIERARTQAQPATRLCGYLLHDAITMFLAICQSEQDVEIGWSEWKKALRVTLGLFH